MTQDTTKKFSEILTHPHLIQNLEEKMGFSSATPIQTQTAPIILEGKNLFAGAKTGSGKTIAFLAPLAQRLLNKEANALLVLAPTRELVLQIDEEAYQLLEGQKEVVSVPLYGGVPIDPQILAIRHHKPKIFIATPGRLLDLFREEWIPTSEIDVIVLDEADRMCDMGFAPQVTEILDVMTAKKQMLLFSATLPKELNEIMDRYCKDPERIQVDKADEASDTLHHKVLFVNRRNKFDHLIGLLEEPGATSLVFARTRKGADELHRALSHEIQSVGILHAGFSMPERERTLRDYREGKIKSLIATDVVSRGIDIDHITHVVHFDLPDQLEDYIHRSGRSGRAGRAGDTIALVDSDRRDAMAKFQDFSKKVEFTHLNEPEAGVSPEDRPRTRRPHGGSGSGRGRQQTSHDGRGHGRSRGGQRNERSERGPSDRSRSRGERPHSKPRHDKPRSGTSPAARSHSAKTGTKEKKPSLISKTKKLLGKFLGKKS